MAARTAAIARREAGVATAAVVEDFGSQANHISKSWRLPSFISANSQQKHSTIGRSQMNGNEKKPRKTRTLDGEPKRVLRTADQSAVKLRRLRG